MNRKNILLFLLLVYSAAGIAFLVFSSDFNLTAATLSSPEKRKTETAAKEETASLESTEAETTELDEIYKEPVYTYTASHSTGRLLIRNGPSLEHDIISFMRPGTTGAVISIGEEWVLLQYGDIEGYVFKGYLELTEVE